MNVEKIKGRLAFLREAERLKSVLRSAHTSSGRQESTAEHSWRLCLMAITFEDAFGGLDMLKILKLCVVHDLGEALGGDIPAVSQAAHPNKSAQERSDLLQLTRSLDTAQQASILALWQEYEDGASPEARAVKALDKLETILQHNQGINPPGFDYAFNLGYGRRYTDADPFFETLRRVVDEGTRQRLRAGFTLRAERAGDAEAIAQLTGAAFRNVAHSSHTEPFIVEALRRHGQLSVSLVAMEGERFVGHVAVSPVAISSGAMGWYGLGPLSVIPERQRLGIGSMLTRAALEALRRLGALGCVVLGDPDYYRRFGFEAASGLVLPGVPAGHFQALPFGPDTPVGEVRYHEAFEATGPSTG